MYARAIILSDSAGRVLCVVKQTKVFVEHCAVIRFAGITDAQEAWTFANPRGFPHWLAGYLHKGESSKTVRAQTITKRAPSFSLTKPGTPYKSITSPGRTGYLSYWVAFTPRPEWERLLDWPEVAAGAISIPLTKALGARIRQAFEDLIAIRQSIHPESAALAENALEQMLLWVRGVHASHKGRLTDERIQLAVQYANENYREAITVEDMAEHAHLSTSRLAHLFAEKVGLAPMRYVETRRMDAAKFLLLTTNDPIYAIARQVGYENPYHFSTRFRRREGVSPRQFRQRALTKR